jgi:hypothetical protein
MIASGIDYSIYLERDEFNRFVYRCSPKNSDGQVRPKKCQS